jgi:glycosyltransferase involved in cell wall biosynthesis
MRILIDPQGALSLSRSRGIGRYTRALIRGIIDNRGEHEILILLNRLFPNEVKAFKREFKGLIPKENFIEFWGVGDNDELNPNNSWNIRVSNILLEKMVDDIKPDIFLITSLFEGAMDNSVTTIGNYLHNTPTAVIFYDLIPFINPQKYLADKMMDRWYRGKIESLKRADLLLSISNSAREEALTHLNFNKDRVVNISTANDTLFSSIIPTDSVQEKYHITRPFLMHTSAFEERKNFIGLINAFAFLPDDIRCSYQLVLVCGLKDEQRKILEDTITSLSLGADEVILTGFAPDEDLIALYKECYLFVFPSLHEGFGLPVLEAMSCGAAVIGSNNSSIPEVIGRDNALFNPYSIPDINKKIFDVLMDKEFHTELKKHSLIQAKKFDWDTTATILIEALESYEHIQTPKETIDIIETIKNIDLDIDDNSLRRVAIAIDRNNKSLEVYRYNLDKNIKLKWRVEGPFDSSYSLALLNRETALALDSLGHNVALHSTEGPGDFEPNPDFLVQNPLLDTLYQKSKLLQQGDTSVTSRNLYPPRVADMSAPINMLHHYAWEESEFPKEWVDEFNSSLTAMTCLSKHVKKVLIDNGVRVPMVTSGCGVDHWESIVADSSYRVEAKEFKFLHVSSCFPRKGADVLLKSYGQAFSSSDDVSLIIKTFANPHNEIDRWLKEAKDKKPNYPDVIIIEDDLTSEELKALYISSDVLVGPSRAEGFGVPFAEAMLSGLAVITTGWSGQMDFCDSDTAWLIDYKFTPAQTHFELFNSVWAEPSPSHLAKLMREVYELPAEQRDQKSKLARERLLRDFSWERVAQRLVDASVILPKQSRDIPKIGWVSSYNSKCGIASYSQHLINAIDEPITIFAPTVDDTIIEDNSDTYRCWSMGDGKSLDKLNKTINENAIEALIIQFNYSFFDFNHFYNFLSKQIDSGRSIIIVMHSTLDAELTPHKKLEQLIPLMAKLSRVLVHSINDLNRLKEYGLVDNVALFPHGILDYTPTPIPKESPSFLLSTYGFFLPHKGLLEVIDVVDILTKNGLDIRLQMVNSAYPVDISQNLIDKAKERIALLGLEDKIELITDFLTDEESLDRLGSSDLILFPYQETGESSSASVRYGLASNRPVAVTPLAIFDDVASASYRLSGTTPQKMAESIKRIIQDIKEDNNIAQKQREDTQRWCKEHRYSSIGERLFNIVTQV